VIQLRSGQLKAGRRKSGQLKDVSLKTAGSFLGQFANRLLADSFFADRFTRWPLFR
jgi:hypothetical protein